MYSNSIKYDKIEKNSVLRLLYYAAECDNIPKRRKEMRKKSFETAEETTAAGKKILFKNMTKEKPAFCGLFEVFSNAVVACDKMAGGYFNKFRTLSSTTFVRIEASLSKTTFITGING